MSKFLTVLLSGVLLQGGVAVGTPMRCASLFGSKTVSSSSLFRPREDGTFFEVIRSNAPQFWAWSKENASRFFSQAQLVEGFVVGDPHIFNFGLAFIDGKYRYSLLDIDDFGRGPIVLDLAHYIAGAKAMSKKVKVKKLVAAYIEGLRGVAPEVPSKLNSLWKSGENEPKFDVKEFESYTPIAKAPASYQTQYRKLEKQFLASRGFESAVEVRFRLKEGGGSQGMPRYIVKGIVYGETKIFEFKMLDASATQYWQSQSPDRAEAIEQSGFRPKNDDENVIIKTSAGDFVSRPRYDIPNIVRKTYEDNPESKKVQAIALYVAQHLGFIVSEHQAGLTLLSLIKQNEEGFTNQVRDFVREYTNDLEALVD